MLTLFYDTNKAVGPCTQTLQILPGALARFFWTTKTPQFEQNVIKKECFFDHQFHIFQQSPNFQGVCGPCLLCS